MVLRVEDGVGVGWGDKQDKIFYCTRDDATSSTGRLLPYHRTTVHKPIPSYHRYQHLPSKCPAPVCARFVHKPEPDTFRFPSSNNSRPQGSAVVEGEGKRKVSLPPCFPTSASNRFLAYLHRASPPLLSQTDSARSAARTPAACKEWGRLWGCGVWPRPSPVSSPRRSVLRW